MKLTYNGMVIRLGNKSLFPALEAYQEGHRSIVYLKFSPSLFKRYRIILANVRPAELIAILEMRTAVEVEEIAPATAETHFRRRRAPSLSTK